MKTKNLSILLLVFLSIHQTLLTSFFDGIYASVKKAATKDRIIQTTILHAAAHLVYKSRGPRTDEKGNWVINGKTITPEKRYKKAMEISFSSLIFHLPPYLFDITFGTESDWKDKEVQTVHPVDENKKTQTTTVISKKQCFATGSGLYCWYADNVLRHIGDVTKNSIGGLSTILFIKEAADKILK